MREVLIPQPVLNAAAAHAKQLGAIRLSLTMAVDNDFAQALYAANGWQRDEKFYTYQLALKSPSP